MIDWTNVLINLIENSPGFGFLALGSYVLVRFVLPQSKNQLELVKEARAANQVAVDAVQKANDQLVEDLKQERKEAEADRKALKTAHRKEIEALKQDLNAKIAKQAEKLAYLERENKKLLAEQAELQINYNNLTVARKEDKDLITSLQEKVDALEAENKGLKTKLEASEKKARELQKRVDKIEENGTGPLEEPKEESK